MCLLAIRQGLPLLLRALAAFRALRSPRREMRDESEERDRKLRGGGDDRY